MIKKIKKTISGICLALIFMVAVIVCFAAIRWNREVKSSTYAEAINNPDKLTILYRPICPRCHRTLPRLFLEHCLDSKGEYLLNANKLSKKQLDNLECRVTPTFRYKNVSYNIDDYQKIDKIWIDSH